MEKNRLYILISAGVAILGSLLPWASLNAGSFGSYSVNGYQGDGWFVIIAAIVSIVLACLNNMNKAMSKGFSIGVIVAGAIATLVTLNSLFNVNKYMSNFGGYGISIGFGLILAILASIALVVTGLLAMSGGKITKESFTESGKDFAQTVGRVTSSTVKTAVEEIKKESQERKKEETTAEKTETAKEETEQTEEAKEPANVEAESVAENAEPVKEETTESETKTEAEPVAEPTETEAEAETVTESTETEPTETEKEAKSAEENAEPVKETEVKNQQEEKAPNQEN